MMKAHWCLAWIVVLAGVACAAKDEDPRFSDDAEKTAQSRRAAIEAEIKGLGEHPWAGEYYEGDGLGVNVFVTLAPQAGFVFEWHGCGGCYDRNYGAVTSDGDRISLDFTFENNREGFRGLANNFVPIRWGERRYLVPADDIIGFCNNVNSGTEPRNGVHGSYLFRRGDEKTKVTGFPSVPEKYRPCLLTEPINAEIASVAKFTTRTSLADWKFKDTPVTLNVGSTAGVRVGMELYVTQPDDMVESVRITKVDEDRCEAIMTQMGETEPAPKVGWRLSTLPRWSRPPAENAKQGAQTNDDKRNQVVAPDRRPSRARRRR